MEEFSSPFSMTVLVSSPQNGKVTVKADLLSDEYVGLDVHEKLVLTSQVNPNTNPVKEIEDDGSINFHDPPEVHHSTHKSKRALSVMPSFDLLQEDMDEGCGILETKEGKSETVTNATIFEHIRKKSKNFPSVTRPAKRNGNDSQFGLHAAYQTSITINDIEMPETIVISDSEPTESMTPNHSESSLKEMEDHSYIQNKNEEIEDYIFSQNLTKHGKFGFSSEAMIKVDRPGKPELVLDNSVLKNEVQMARIEVSSALKGSGENQREKRVNAESNPNGGDGGLSSNEVARMLVEKQCSAEVQKSKFDVSFLGCRSVFHFL